MDKQNKQKNKNLLIKLISLLFGFSCWFLFMHQQNIYRHIMVPLCFDDIPPHMSVAAPEMVEITLCGKRIDLHTIDPDTLGFHINAKSLKKGKNRLSLSADQIFLPDQVSLLNYAPSTILVYMHENQNHT